MIFKIYDCDFGIKYNGVNYDFENVDNMQIENPENTKLIRGANGTNLIGLPYKEGLKEGKKVTVTIKGMSAALKAVLDTAYANKDRMDVFCISRSDGSSKIGKNAILANQPVQLTIDENPDSMNVALIFETFDLSEVHKS